MMKNFLRFRYLLMIFLILISLNYNNLIQIKNMQFTKFVVLAALFGLATIDNNNVNAIQITESIASADFNGADEDEIMDKVFSKYSVEGKDHNGVKNGQKILMKSTAPKAAGVILEATHKLKGTQVPGYMKANFEKAWDRFDIN
jgi:hypothetical protein